MGTISVSGTSKPNKFGLTPREIVDVNRTISASELIISPAGEVFHLRLCPDQIADVIVLVGDPARVKSVSAHFDTREVEISNREFCTVTGNYRGRRMSVISHGIGTDNIDIVMTELDALANVDFATRQVRPEFRRLTLLRLGTCGALQPDIDFGEMIFARTSVGFDGLLNWYDGRGRICNRTMEWAFMRHTEWNPLLPQPYFVDADADLWHAFSDCTTDGITASAPGFYAPQGRWVRLRPADTEFIRRVSSFRFEGRCITNFEMESSALAGLAALMGHRAATICTVIAQRTEGTAQVDYAPFVEKMIKTALDRLVEI